MSPGRRRSSAPNSLCDMAAGNLFCGFTDLYVERLWSDDGVVCFYVQCRHSGPVGNSTSNEKPFACPVPGCKKRYKNVNGIKYHSKNGHKKDGK